MIIEKDFENEDYEMMTDIVIETVLNIIDYPIAFDCNKTADDVLLRVRMEIHDQIHERLERREEKLERVEKVMKLLMERRNKTAEAL